MAVEKKKKKSNVFYIVIYGIITYGRITFLVAQW